MSLLRRFQPTLLTRLALSLALLGLLPVGLVASRLIGVNRQAMTDQAESTHLLTARKTAEGIGAYVETQIALSLGLASNPALADPLSQPARVLLKENLEAWVGLGVQALAVVNDKGEQVILAQIAEPEVRDRVSSVFAELREEQVAAYGRGEELLIRVSSPIPGTQGEVWLVSAGAGLAQELEAFELGEEAQVSVLDRVGHVMLGETFEFPIALLQLARGGRIQGVIPSFRLGGEEFLGAQAPVPNTRWTVVSRQPSRVARAAENRMRRQALLALGLAILVAVSISGFAYASVIRPIRQVAQAQRRLAGIGEGATGGDEIGQLTRSFEALERRLRDREALDEVFLGRYRVVEVIGSGAMGTVFRGLDPKLKRPVAIKTIRLGTRLTADRRRELILRLMDEAVMVAKFNHPNIVAIYDVEDRPEAAFVAMEFVDGDSLENLLWRARRLDWRQVAALGAAIADALAAAHDHGLVHRDVKPANILLGLDGSIKVTDFGIAALATEITGREDVIFGTPGYLPPEALQGLGYGKAGDLFALGSILYYALTGHRPFPGRTMKEIIRQTLFSRVADPGRLAPEVPPELSEILRSLLEKDVGKRLGDAAEVARRLERFCAAHDARWSPDPGLFTGEDQPPAAGVAESQLLPTRRLDRGGRAA